MLAGLATDVCVAHTALDARRLGYAVTVVEAGCRGIDTAGSLTAWERMTAAVAHGFSRGGHGWYDGKCHDTARFTPVAIASKCMRRACARGGSRPHRADDGRGADQGRTSYGAAVFLAQAGAGESAEWLTLMPTSMRLRRSPSS